MVIRPYRWGRLPGNIGGMSDSIITISDDALAAICQMRDAEPGDEEYALFMAIAGIQGPQFTYDLSFMPVADKEASDVLERHGDLAVIIPEKDVANFRDAVLAISSDPASPGLAMNNPNSPSPAVGAASAPAGDLSGPVADRVQQVLEAQVNPAIAGHGGAARLVSVDGGTVYLELMGGCQGCGMAAVTLRQGIERILRDNVPEITEVVDATNHAAGDNPYYSAAKK